MKDETTADIVREMREKWATYYYAEDSMRSDGALPEDYEDIDVHDLADRIGSAHEREIDARNLNAKNIHSEILRLASWVRELTGTSMARERGVSASEVRNIAVKLEVLADKSEVK